MINSILVKYGEIALRGKNREKFELLLISQIRNAVGENASVKREQGRFFVDCPHNIQYIERIRKIPGVHSVCPCVKASKPNMGSLRPIIDLCVQYVTDYHPESDRTFKVKTRRADKSWPLTSNEISAAIGEAILENCSNLSVKMLNPDFVLNVELRSGVYLYSSELAGYGGLPVSSSGRALCLLSGGIDSPVAAFMAAKRGVYSEFVYFDSPPYVSVMAREKVIELAQKVGGYMGGSRLHIVRFTEVQEYLREKTPQDKLTIFMKRSMLSIAEKLAEKNRMQALIVGDSIGQVASQTLHAINAIDSAVKTSVLRPLAGCNKQETIDLAREIGTFEISIQPYEDCCTVFVPKHPETKPKKSVIEAIERGLDNLPELIENAIKSIETIAVGKN